MRPFTLIVFAVLVACGKTIELDDAATDAPSESVEANDTVCVNGTFGPPISITQLNTTLDERDIRFSADELTAAFSRGSEVDGGLPTASTTVYTCTRPSKALPFGPVTPLVHDPATGVVYPTLSGDALRLWSETLCEDFTSGCTPLQLAVFDPDAGVYRPTGDSLYIENEPNGPFGAGSIGGDGIVTSDGGAYYYASLVDSGAPDGALDGVFVASGFPSTVGHYTYYTSSRPVFLPTDTTTFVDNPIVTIDELTLFASTVTTSEPVRHVSVAVRGAVSDPFGPLRPVHELDSTDGEYPSWISPDGCRLYLTRIIGGQRDLYVATRSQ